MQPVPMLSLCALGLLTAATAAQESPALLFSLTGDTTLAGVPVQDEEVLLHDAFGTPRPAWPTETWAALFGDPGSATSLAVPGDIDALHDQGVGPGGGLAFSLVGDEFGHRDGDVLTLVGDEVVPWIEEETLVAVLGVVDGNLDVDALLLDADGSWWLSLAEDEDSSLLSGDVAGEISDGAVLRWDPATGDVSVEFTASQIDGFVQQALGTTSSSGDTKGLARDPVSGSLLFSVQSPSAHDGSVFSSQGGGQLLFGHTEDDLGFDGAVELDALSVARVRWPGLTSDQAAPPAGATFVLTVEGDEPHATHLVVVSLGLDLPWFVLPGWGGIALEEDALFGAGLAATPSLLTVADGLGRASLTALVPPAVGPLDVHFQSLEWFHPHAASNPIALELGL